MNPNLISVPIKTGEAHNGYEESEDFTVSTIEEVEIFSCANCHFESDSIDELDDHMVENHDIKDSDFELVRDEVPEKKTTPSFCVSPPKLSGAVKNNGPQIENYTNNSGNSSSRKRPAEFSIDSERSRKKAKNDTLICGWCNFSTQEINEMKLHRQTHSTADPSTVYKCPQCQYQTKRKNDMPKHMLGHCTDVEMYHCPECSYKTKRKCDLPKHVLRHKPAGSVPLYRCDFCCYVTKRKGDLSKHVKNHTEKSQSKSFRCVECDYCTGRAKDLQEHMLIHANRQTEGVLKGPYVADEVQVRFSEPVQSTCHVSEDSVNLDAQEGIHVILDAEDYREMEPLSQVVGGTAEVCNIPVQEEGVEYVIEAFYTNAETGEIIDPSLVEEEMYVYENEDYEENQQIVYINQMNF